MSQNSPIKRYLKSSYFSVGISATMEEVSQIFQRKPSLQFLPVEEDGLFKGVIFRTNYVNEFLLCEEGDCNVKDLLSQQIVHLRPTDSIQDAKEIFDLDLFFNIPIVNDFGQLCGTLFPEDLQSIFPLFVREKELPIYWS